MGYTYNCVTSPTFPLELLHFLHKNTPTTAATLAADTPTSNCVRLAIGQLIVIEHIYINYVATCIVDNDNEQKLLVHVHVHGKNRRLGKSSLAPASHIRCGLYATYSRTYYEAIPVFSKTRIMEECTALLCML